MSGTEYRIALCDEPLERFEIRPSGFKNLGAWTAGSFWSIGSVFDIFLCWFWSVSAQFVISIIFLRFLSFSL